jgi:DNA-binding NarL/FixJ family response regulator
VKIKRVEAPRHSQDRPQDGAESPRSPVVAHRMAAAVIAEETGAATLIRDYLGISPRFQLHKWCSVDPQVVATVIGADVVVIESCISPLPPPNRPQPSRRTLPQRLVRVGFRESELGMNGTKPSPAVINPRGIECLRLLKRMRYGLPIVMFACQPDLRICLQCFQMGADGYFVTPGTPESFEQILSDATMGWHSFSKEIQGLFVDRLSYCALTGRAALLTPAEIEVVRCFADGLRDKDIAELRNTSVATVHALTSSILKKLKVHRRVDAVRALLRLG